MPCPLKICFTNKVNTICGGGQLLVTGSQGPITRVLVVRISCPRVASPRAQSPSSRVSGSQGLGSQRRRSQGPGSQVLILDYAILDCSEGVVYRQPFSKNFRKFSFGQIIDWLFRAALYTKMTPPRMFSWNSPESFRSA